MRMRINFTRFYLFSLSLPFFIVSRLESFSSSLSLSVRDSGNLSKLKRNKNIIESKLNDLNNTSLKLNNNRSHSFSSFLPCYDPSSPCWKKFYEERAQCSYINELSRVVKDLLAEDEDSFKS